MGLPTHAQRVTFITVALGLLTAFTYVAAHFTDHSKADAASTYNAQLMRAFLRHPMAQGTLGNAPPSVGALFQHDMNGSRFCTASVVDSPHGNLLITAAHCVFDGGSYRGDTVFVPGYSSGQAPYGVWTVTNVIVDQAWQSSQDADHDVAFLVTAPLGNQNIADAVGANTLTVNAGYDDRVTVFGYPGEQQQPISCTNFTKPFTQHQLQFDCTGYTNGTSGAPLIFRQSRLTGTGKVIGVIGGYEQGGQTPSVSYSVAFGNETQALYKLALTRS